MARLGRRPGESRTREAIADAARRNFARSGYDRTTIRAIARDAGVDPALVIHFFGTKEQVFAAVMELPFDPERELPAVLEGDRDQLGARITRFFLEVWEGPETGPAMAGLLRSAASYDAAAVRLREIVEARLLRPMAAAIGAPDAALRAELAAAQLVGLALARYVLRVEPLASADRDELVAAVAPAVQRHLSGE